jgi:hypothetical protein
MNVANWLQAISAAIGIVGGIGISMRWIVKHYLNELKPNHGTSLNDKIVLEIIPLLKKLDRRQDEIREDVTEMKVAQARLEGRFEQHVDEGE